MRTNTNIHNILYKFRQTQELAEFQSLQEEWRVENRRRRHLAGKHDTEAYPGCPLCEVEVIKVSAS